MAILGLRSSGNFVGVTGTTFTNDRSQRPENWREGILLLYPNGKAPLTALTSQMKSREVDDFTYNWWEKEIDDRRVTISANITTTTQTTITVAAGAASFLRNGDVLHVEATGELVRVSTQPASATTTTFAVERGFGGTTAAVMTTTTAGTNPNFFVVGSSFGENSDAPRGTAFDPTLKYNYTQIFRNTLELSRTAMKTRLRTGDAVREAKRETLEIHSVDIERALWFGYRGLSTDTVTGNPLHSMNGVLAQIPSANITTITTAVTPTTTNRLTMETFEGLMLDAFRYGSSEKVGFCGNRALMAMNQMARHNSQYNMQFGVKEYGMNVARFLTPFGELVLKSHPLFNMMTGGTDYNGIESWLFILDMANLQYVYLKESDTKYEPVLQNNGVDGMKSGYLTECGFELHHPKTHYLIKGLIAGGADA